MKVEERNITNTAKDGKLLELARGRSQVESFLKGVEHIASLNLCPRQEGYKEIRRETIYPLTGETELFRGGGKPIIMKPGKVYTILGEGIHYFKNQSEEDISVLLRTSQNRFDYTDLRCTKIADNSRSIYELFLEAEQITGHCLLPGEVGGNHYHKRKTEIIEILEGKIDLHLKDMEPEEYKGERKIIIGREVVHALRNPSERDVAVFIEIATLAFNPDNPRNDVYPIQLTE